MIKHCSHCGTPVIHAIPPGDSLPRHICPSCQHIQYENPRIIVGCVATFEHQILLCRRAIQPRYGLWTLPAGFMENGETTREGAIRESFEEACAEVVIDAAFALVSIAHINQVHLFYRGRLCSPDYASGEESLEVSLFDPEQIPWNELAFTSVRYCLERYLNDLATGYFGFHEISLPPT